MVSGLLREEKAARDLPEPLRLAAPPAPEPAPSLEGSETLEVRLDRPLDETVQAILQVALDLEGGNRSRAARRLGVSLRTMPRFAARMGTRTRH
jgi:DNA-binding NtrC family response regulator